LLFGRAEIRLGRRKIEIGNLFYARRKNSLKMRDLFFARDNIDLELEFPS